MKKYLQKFLIIFTRKITESQIREAVKNYGTKSIKGNKPWIQNQIGDKSESFEAGVKWTLELLKMPIEK